MNLCLIKASLIHDLYFEYVVEVFITLINQYKYTNPFSSMSLVRIHLFLSINFSYTTLGVEWTQKRLLVSSLIFTCPTHSDYCIS